VEFRADRALQISRLFESFNHGLDLFPGMRDRFTSRHRIAAFELQRRGKPSICEPYWLLRMRERRKFEDRWIKKLSEKTAFVPTA